MTRCWLLLLAVTACSRADGSAPNAPSVNLTAPLEERSQPPVDRYAADSVEHADGGVDDRLSDLYDDLEDLTEHGDAEKGAPDEQRQQLSGEYEQDAEDVAPAGTGNVARTLQRPRSVGFPDRAHSSSGHRDNVTRPERLFRFWDPYQWTATSGVSAMCADHMEQYRSALRHGDMWAFKGE